MRVDDESLTGDPMTDELVPLVEQLADAVYRGAADEIAALRVRAEAVAGAHGRFGDAAWGMAIVAAAMLPGRVPPRLLLGWRHVPAPEPLPPVSLPATAR